MIIAVLVIIFIVSFLLAYRTLIKLKIPARPTGFWVIILFLKGQKIKHYSSSDPSVSSEEVSVPEAVNSSNNSERMEV